MVRVTDNRLTLTPTTSGWTICYRPLPQYTAVREMTFYYRCCFDVISGGLGYQAYTRNFSPGYGDWDCADLFGLLFGPHTPNTFFPSSSSLSGFFGICANPLNVANSTFYRYGITDNFEPGVDGADIYNFHTFNLISLTAYSEGTQTQNVNILDGYTAAFPALSAYCNRILEFVNMKVDPGIPGNVLIQFGRNYNDVNGVSVSAFNSALTASGTVFGEQFSLAGQGMYNSQLNLLNTPKYIVIKNVDYDSTRRFILSGFRLDYGDIVP